MNTQLNQRLTAKLTQQVAKPESIDFGIITSMDDFKAKRNMLAKASGQVGKSFNEFVRASVRYFYHGGNKNIVVINDLLRIAFQSQSFNTARLGAYLKQCVPHKYENDGVKGVCPTFGARQDKKEYDWKAVETFLSRNLEWAKYGKEVTAASFEQAKYLSSVLSTLKREKVDVKAFALDLIEKDAAKKAAGASK